MKRYLLFLVASAAIVRLIALAFALHGVGEGALVYGDAYGYIDFARHLFIGDGFGREVNGVFTPEVFRTPGLPVLLAPFVGSSFGLISYIVLLSIAAGAGLPLLTYGLARRVAGDAAADLAATFAAFEPHLIYYSLLPQTEVPFTLLSLGGILLLILAVERSSIAWAVLGGALSALAAYVRPGYWDIYIALSLLFGALLFWRRESAWRYAAIGLIAACAVVAPWYLRNHAETGVYAFSGMGWRNVYTDYLASLRSIDNGTSFGEEKQGLFAQLSSRYGYSPTEAGSPAHAALLRTLSLREMWERKTTVLKLEPVLVGSFFLQDGYYYELRRLGFITEDSQVKHISSTATLMRKGIAAVPDILAELERQAFVPLWGRLLTALTAILAAIGFFLTRRRERYVYASVVAVTAVVSSVVGLSIEARMRVPVEPFLFIFASIALVWIYEKLRGRRAAI